MSSLLIIDDEEKLRNLLARILGLEGYQVSQAANAAAALRQLEREIPDVIISDVRLPDAGGLELLLKLKEIAPDTEVILLTAYGTIADGVQAIKNGAFDYLTKGDDNDRIIPLVVGALEKRNLRLRIQNLEQRIQSSFDFDAISGISPGIKQAINLASKVARGSTTVLLQGETGTGKEVFAQAIHQASGRNRNAFLAINCSAFSREIMESELFGYRAGAFTGALKNKRGLFEEADGGTLFLDEIGEIPLDIQAKLLRVLENGSFIKLGETQEKTVNVRIIAATNRNLKNEIAEGRFREDLFFRISAFTILLPPLRERPEDIKPLALQFISSISSRLKLNGITGNAEFFNKLQAYFWKGNIRELKNVIERALILCETQVLDASLLPEDLVLKTTPVATRMAGIPDLQTLESEHIAFVLRQTSWNKAETARLLGIGISTLYRKIEDYGLLPES